MFGFGSGKLKKDDLKGIAALMYQDVSKNSWDRENLTKRNLDFSVESVRIIDKYAERLMRSQYDTDLLNSYFDNFVSRLGAYIGEVIRRDINQDFYWYESDSVDRHSAHFEVQNTTQTVLYSKKRDTVIDPLTILKQFLRGKSSYSSLIHYAEETIKRYS
ncbi:hypothetical protein ACQCVP_13150 [Rossellomorea vietnamensis]|uniref:hypothetical protein n=1 Tax=Rossellomorea vietnamensis TaxID=218284 RepID=UPI003CF62249